MGLMDIVGSKIKIFGGCWVVVGTLLFASAPALAASVEGESVVNAGASSATLEAQVNPEGSDVTYAFEYGTSAAYGADVSAVEGTMVSGSVEALVRSLSPSTLYHFRVVIKSLGGTTLATGKDETFTTQTVGGELMLPDGRRWDLVSPSSTQGAVIEPISQGALQASEDGGAITYLAEAPLGSDPVGSPLFTQVLSSRGADGAWTSQDISTPHEVASGVSVGEGQEYRLLSSSLALALVEPLGETPLSSLASERTLYLRDDPPVVPDAAEQSIYDETGEEAIQGESFPPGYLPLVAPYNVPPGTHIAAHSGASSRGLEFLGATVDLSHVVFRSEEALTSNAIKNPESPEAESLYEWTQGKLQLVSILPNGRPVTEPEVGAPGFNAALGEQNEDVRNAIASDGSRVVWQAFPPFEGHHLYVRDVAKNETIQIDTPESGAGDGNASPLFQGANDEATKLFFTDTQQLTKGSTAEEGGQQGEGDLYECEVTTMDGKLSCDLRDLTVDSHSGQSAHVLGAVLGVSEEGSSVYFVAEGELANGAKNEADNLYVSHEEEGVWSTTFIASLSSGDQHDWDVFAGNGEDLGHLTARVSPNGRYLAFMSQESLTGYNNRDAYSDEEDTEVYLYDSATGHLTCASCDPTGARPVGMFDVGKERQLVDRTGASEERWLAGSIPGWTPMAGAEGIALYQSRYLSDDGRLFFDSEDALVPQDTNGEEDVYEYEPQGIGSCGGSSETFSVKSGGCVNLISSGISNEESAFLDASASGEDVFFLTSAKLVTADSDTGYHVYDAHVCGADGVACESTVVSPPPCVTAESCKQAPASQPEIFGSPSSATFSGVENVTVSTSKPTATSKSVARAQQLAKALKLCAKKPKRKRAICKLRARKKYEVATKRKPVKARRVKREVRR
jgi:hypothetical protein